MLRALLAGEVDLFREHLKNFAEKVFSYYDVGQGQTEHLYHAFFLGLLARYEYAYHIRSNRESGRGRYDIALFPKDPARCGVLIELKSPGSFKEETLDHALAVAEKQLKNRKYDTEMVASGIEKVVRVAIAVQGKEARVKEISS